VRAVIGVVGRFGFIEHANVSPIFCAGFSGRRRSLFSPGGTEFRIGEPA
jgi:hypothetical protein